jgi:hypothetical protein
MVGGEAGAVGGAGGHGAVVEGDGDGASGGAVKGVGDYGAGGGSDFEVGDEVARRRS